MSLVDYSQLVSSNSSRRWRPVSIVTDPQLLLFLLHVSTICSSSSSSSFLERKKEKVNLIQLRAVQCSAVQVLNCERRVGWEKQKPNHKGAQLYAAATGGGAGGEIRAEMRDRWLLLLDGAIELFLLLSWVELVGMEGRSLNRSPMKR